VFEGLYATQYMRSGPRSITYTERRVLARSFSEESAIYHHSFPRKERRATEDQISEYMKSYKDIINTVKIAYVPLEKPRRRKRPKAYSIIVNWQ